MTNTEASFDHLDVINSVLSLDYNLGSYPNHLRRAGLYPRQVLFPMAGAKGGWARLASDLKAGINPELVEAYRGMVSLPFEAGENRRIAVEIVGV
ncbi:MAG: hypothetical protein U9Q68_06100 [Euryarchaeota archaeon]|nr:MAG: hypothetical protein C5S48_06990 [ANME-2 cluster archaeon]MEA3282122.1 hypothetical protein [Euryarchaeota archaeon]